MKINHRILLIVKKIILQLEKKNVGNYDSPLLDSNIDLSITLEGIRFSEYTQFTDIHSKFQILLKSVLNFSLKFFEEKYL